MSTQRIVSMVEFAGVPSGAAVAGALALDTTTGQLYNEFSGAWVAVSGGGAGGNVNGPGGATDNAIVRFNGPSGTLIQDSGITIPDGASGSLAGSNSGDVTLAGPNYLTIAGQVITTHAVALASQVSGQLPFANLANLSASQLLGRESGSSGVPEAITLGTNLSMSGATLNASGGGGNVIDSTAFGSEPGSPAPGDLDMYSDGRTIAQWTGSIWAPWGPIFPLTKPPAAAGFTGDNAGSATLADSKGGLFFTLPVGGGGGGSQVHMYYKALSAAPYTLIVQMNLTLFHVANTSWFGIALRASGGEIITISSSGMQDGSANVLRIDKWNSSVSYNNVYVNANANHNGNLFVRVQDTSGTSNLRNIDISADGINWINVHSVGRTDFMTATQWGPYAYLQNSGSACGVLINSVVN